MRVVGTPHTTVDLKGAGGRVDGLVVFLCRTQRNGIRVGAFCASDWRIDIILHRGTVIWGYEQFLVGL
jgi:hypothetical protein